MKKRSRLFSVVLACCLVLQGLLSWVLPFQSGMLIAAELEAAEIAIEPAAPPCHSAKSAVTQHTVAHDHAQAHGPHHHHEHDEDCCEQAVTPCSNLCYWACAFTSAPPQTVPSRMATLMPEAPAAGLVNILAPWVPPIPTPPPIQTATALA